MKNNYIKSPMNYVGGKHKLLPQILPLFPSNIDVFVDLFCGGFNVGININANKIIGNDNNYRVIQLLKMFQEYDGEEIIKRVNNIIDKYGLSKSSVYGYEKYGVNWAKENSSGLAKYNKDKFLKLREDFNNNQDDVFMMYTTIIFSYNCMMQFKNGVFTNGVNKVDFNKNIQKNIMRFCKELNSKDISFICKDYKSIPINKNNFVYIDPPYLLGLANYNKTNNWDLNSENNLLCYCDILNDNNIKFALSNVLEHKGKKNDLLIEWSKKYNTHYLNFHYNGCNFNNKKSNKKTVEVLITNY